MIPYERVPYIVRLISNAIVYTYRSIPDVALYN